MKSSRHNMQSRNRVLSALKDAQENGQLKGVLGRLGDLGTIESKYDVAISTSCSYLDHIVVETIEQGEAVISHLKHHHIGRVNLICLDRVTKQNAHQKSRPFIPPTHSTRLYDLISVKSSNLQDAFYFAIRNTLVCDTVEVAQHTAFNLN